MKYDSNNKTGILYDVISDDKICVYEINNYGIPVLIINITLLAFYEWNIVNNLNILSSKLIISLRLISTTYFIKIFMWNIFQSYTLVKIITRVK